MASRHKNVRYCRNKILKRLSEFETNISKNKITRQELGLNRQFKNSLEDLKKGRFKKLA